MPRTAAVYNRVALALVLVAALGLSACEGSRGNVSRSVSGITNNGSLEVRSTPEGARVYVNNHFEGTTPHRMNLDRGVHRVVVEKPGYQRYEEWSQVEPGKKVVIEARLETE